MLNKIRLILAVIYLLGAISLYFVLSMLLIKIVSIGTLLICGGYQIIIYEKLHEKRVKKAVIKMISNNQAKETLGMKTITVSNGQLIYAENNGEQRINRFKSIGESARCYFLQKDDVAAIILPKRVFSTAEDKQSFLGHMGGMVGDFTKNHDLI